MGGSNRSHRRRPNLNVDTFAPNSPSHRRDAAPGSSPQRKAPGSAKGKPPVSSRALKLQTTPSAATTSLNGRDRNFEESFLENDTPVDMANKENEPDFSPESSSKSPANYRDSHDLSLPARQVTRDSLVTNMLLSLDAFSLSQINTPATPLSPFDEGTYGSMSMSGDRDDMIRTMSGISARPGRGMHSSYNHGHSYTYSSDLEGTDDGTSRISSQFSHGRRSNSSSGFQTGLGRINSMQETSSARANTMTGGRPLHSRGGKASKNSSINSFDAGGTAHVLGNHRIPHGIGRRSSSFDYPPSNSGNTAVDGNGTWNIDFSNSLFNPDDEGAPTPTVPGGPRRPTAALLPPAPPTLPKKPEQDERKRSLRSRGSTTTGRAASKHRQHEMPSQPVVHDLDSAPAPNVGYEKSQLRETSSTAQTPPTQPKERPGFFRKIFGGSSKNTQQSSQDPPDPVPVSTPSAETIERPTSKTPQHIASQITPSSAPPSRDSHQPQPPHVIQKKSSFFRRRKKSIAEPPPVPLPPPNLASIPNKARKVLDPMDLDDDPIMPLDRVEHSPASSLRQVMIPYLKSSNPATPSGLLPPRIEREIVSPEYDVEDSEYERRRKTRGFSPDYDPTPNATIRPVKSQSALNTRNRESLNVDVPRLPTKANGAARELPEIPGARPKLGRDTTFFEDNSDTEVDRSHIPAPEHRRPSLLSPAESQSLPGGFPTPPSTTPTKELPQPPLTPEHKTMNDRFSLKEAASPTLVLQQNVSNEEGRARPDSLGLPIQTQITNSPGKLNVSGRNTPLRTGSTSSLPSVHIESPESIVKPAGSPLDEPEITVGEPTEDDRQKAQRIFDGSEDFIQKERAAAWMGEEGPVRQRTLLAYMELYDFTEKSVLTGLREICDRLILRAETQQIDRILVAFSERWCACNPNHGFKAMDVIHTMCYSIMLLNTDLHVADIEHKMTRSQFIKNTMTTVKAALADSIPDAFDRPSILPGRSSMLSPNDNESPVATEQEKKNWRASFIPPRSDSRIGDYDQEPDSCGPLVKAPFNGTMRQWEAQMEIVLKDIYNSIRDDRLPLFGGAPEPPPQQQPGGLFAMNVLRRTPSVISKSPSESASTTRGRLEGTGGPNGRWSSKSRSRPRLGTAGFSSSRTSFDDGNSIWSPAGSSATWSRYSLGRTQTSPSMDSLGSHYLHSDYHQSMGFASALSQAIIREDHQLELTRSVMSEEVNGAALLDDESLELTGPPWMKEGIVIHKHHLDGIDKKAKDRNWSEVFAVIQKGQLSLFSFSSKSTRQKTRLGRKHGAGAVVGGGNWQENATNLGTFSLRQTLASALPPPGYSRTRPNVWALSLPTGAVHLFQVGTPEISKEFVLTVNYWSARLSTHPLVGGISNIEYGWSDACINNALVAAMSNDSHSTTRPGSAAAGRTSMHSRNGSRQSSLRSSFEVGGSGVRAKLPGDRIHISEWAPPAQSMRPSTFSESEQLETLEAYVKSIEDELQKHNQLRSPMLLAFTPRGNNASKAMANWEKKSAYLLREIVKFRTYVDSLQTANTRRKEIYDEREIARRAARGDHDEEEAMEDEDDDTKFEV
ncbi:hypothetical protein PFICI_12538 [Pestalotiopsis fici W106-1]|uniref:SEC7 domain-containing protein n=1 Tax=Pestalotiopsis fici (strain W106-1 / CGMCC3.15140) TaxID=1229662 RepID=W3WP64_PESFW|nr:uncharacterized protein PFICI_12538 [Pestalotiopsis fici W106-1]ETS75594.1 hypothetical protein PFICI_12538 [Pestalotiopsis fici W106-1]